MYTYMDQNYIQLQDFKFTEIYTCIILYYFLDGCWMWKVAHALHRQKNVEATVRRNIQSRNPGTVTSRNEHSKRNIENIPQKTCNISKLVHHW